MNGPFTLSLPDEVVLVKKLDTGLDLTTRSLQTGWPIEMEETIYFTRSAAKRKRDVEKAVKVHSDHERIIAGVSSTGKGIHLRWDWDREEHSRTASLAERSFTALGSISSTSSESAISTKASSSSASSSEDEENVDESGLRTPTPSTRALEDIIPPTPTKRPRPLQRDHHGAGSDQRVLWHSNISGITAAPTFHHHDRNEEEERDLMIARVQLARLEEIKRKRDAQWEEAIAVGAFDDVEEEEDEGREEAAGGDSGYDASQSLMSDAGDGTLYRHDTLKCNPQEPPSKLGPTLPTPVLPYVRTLDSTASTDTSSSSPPSTTSHSRTASTSSRGSCSCNGSVVHRYQENGVWKTKGAFEDIPTLTHLAALGFDTLTSDSSCSSKSTLDDSPNTRVVAWHAEVNRRLYDTHENRNILDAAALRLLSRESTEALLDSQLKVAVGYSRTLDAFATEILS